MMVWLSCDSRCCDNGDLSERSTAPLLSAPHDAFVYLAGRFGVTLACRDTSAIYRKQAWLQLATVAALLFLALLTVEAQAHQMAPFNRRLITVTRAERRGHFCRTRIPYDSKTDATYQGS